MRHSSRIFNIQKIIRGANKLLHVPDDAAIVIDANLKTFPGELHDVVKGYQHILFFANFEQSTGAVIAAGGSIKDHVGEIADK